MNINLKLTPSKNHSIQSTPRAFYPYGRISLRLNFFLTTMEFDIFIFLPLIVRDVYGFGRKFMFSCCLEASRNEWASEWNIPIKWKLHLQWYMRLWIYVTRSEFLYKSWWFINLIQLWILDMFDSRWNVTWIVGSIMRINWKELHKGRIYY